MPIIESLADVYYPRSKYAPAKFLKQKLHYESPYLMWFMFRNSLLHGDYPSSARYGNKTVEWRISYNGGHYIKGGILNIDIVQLYEDIDNFFKSEINKNLQKNVRREYEIKFINIKSIKNKFVAEQIIEEFKLSQR